MKKRIILNFICVLMAAIFVSCATMPSGVSIGKSPEGDYLSVKKSENAINDAKEGANVFCAKSKQTAIILDEKTEYEGGLAGEKTDTLLKKGADIAFQSGGGLTTSRVVDSATGDAKYVAKIRFKCE